MRGIATPVQILQHYHSGQKDRLRSKSSIDTLALEYIQELRDEAISL
jgi:hypothetical protein